MNTMSIPECARDNLVRVEAPGCVINVRVGLSDTYSRRVTAVEILAGGSRHTDEAPWWFDGEPGAASRSIRIVQGGSAAMSTREPEAALYDLPGWDTADSMAAVMEGWNIADCLGPEGGPFELQALGYLGVFATDHEAWWHVVARAADGSKLHQRALAFIKQFNREQFDEIVDLIGAEPVMEG